MPARSVRLARGLISKLRILEAALLDDAAPDESEESARRQEAIAKVLLAEEGIEDFAKSGLVLTAMPNLRAFEEPTDREVSELAEFLDRQLVLSQS